MKNKLPEKTVERLSLCRRVLLSKLPEDKRFIYSHEIAKLLHITPVQVRRDFMLMGYTGSPSKGYDIQKLVSSIGKTIDSRSGVNVAVIGVGNLGTAIFNYLHKRREKLHLVAGFDRDPEVIASFHDDVPCFHISKLPEKVKELNIRIVIITVPGPAAKEVKELALDSGIKGILNFTPSPMKVPENVFLEEYDIVTSLEKVSYFVK